MHSVGTLFSRESITRCMTVTTFDWSTSMIGVSSAFSIPGIFFRLSAILVESGIVRNFQKVTSIS